MKYRTPLIATIVPLCAGLALAAGPGYAGASPTHRTTFAFGSSGYGTRVTGGQLPASSDTTAYQVVGCTNRAGVHRTNDVADATVPGLGTLSGVRTRVWTTQRNGVTASHSTHRIAELDVASSGLGSLSLQAITSRSTAYHDARGFHTATATAIGGIRFTPPVGPAQSFPAPTPDRPVEVPGLATISIGRHHGVHDARNASADAFAIRVDVIPTATSVKVAHTHAELHSGLTYGVFRGHSNATRVVHALTTVVHSGPNPLTLMPCQGTYGAVARKAVARVDLGDQLAVRGLSSSDRGSQTAHEARGLRAGRRGAGRHRARPPGRERHRRQGHREAHQRRRRPQRQGHAARRASSSTASRRPSRGPASSRSRAWSSSSAGWSPGPPPDFGWSRCGSPCWTAPERS